MSVHVSMKNSFSEQLFETRIAIVTQGNLSFIQTIPSNKITKHNDKRPLFGVMDNLKCPFLR